MGKLEKLVISLLCIAIAVAVGYRIRWKIITKPSKPLREVISDNDIEQLKLHIRWGTDLDRWKDHPNWDDTPLLLAIAYRRTEIVEMLLQAGADVNHTTPTYHPPLTHAMMLGLEECAQIILDHEADPNALGPYDETALHFAAIGSTSPEMLSQLIRRDADVNLKDHYGRTPLHLAAFAGDTTKARILLDEGSDINAQTYVKWIHGPPPNEFNQQFMEEQRGWSPLHYAASVSRSQTLLELLIERGAQLRLRDLKGRTAADIAENRGNKSVLPILTEQSEGRP